MKKIKFLLLLNAIILFNQLNTIMLYNNIGDLSYKEDVCYVKWTYTDLKFGSFSGYISPIRLRDLTRTQWIEFNIPGIGVKRIDLLKYSLSDLNKKEFVLFISLSNKNEVIDKLMNINELSFELRKNKKIEQSKNEQKSNPEQTDAQEAAASLV